MKKIDKEELHSIFIGIKDGNELAFNNLYKKYKGLVYAVAFSILKSRENSEEIVQKVFIKLWRIDKNKLPKSNEASWLYSMTKNETLNFLRNQKEESNIDEVYYITDADKELNEIIEKDTYNRILSKLNKKDQEIVSLKILSNLSFKEISQILDMPIGTVQWKYYKSLHILKILLSNLSMFIITMMAFVLRKLSTRKKQSNQEEIKEDMIDDITENIQESTSKKEETNITEDTTITADRVETIKVEENSKMTVSDIGILSASSIFLIATIIFFIKFIKHQQTAKKKVSK